MSSRVKAGEPGIATGHFGAFQGTLERFETYRRDSVYNSIERNPPPIRPR